MIPGLTTRLTSAGIPVMRLHYSADAKKRPGTPEGDQWLTHATSGYPGGTNSPRWRKEMEIDYGALGGTRLIPGWEQWRLNGRIVIPPFEAEGYTLYGSYDHGWRHRAAYHVHGVNGEGEVVTLWEWCDAHVPYQYIAKIIQGETVRVPPLGCACPTHQGVRVFTGNPYAGRERLKVADPSIWASDQQQSDHTMKSTATLFRKDGVHFTPAQRGMDTTVAEWLMGYYWADPLQPRYRITTACPALIWEIGQQRHKEVSAQAALNRAQPEQLVDKDNDAWDSMKYFLSRFPPTPGARVPTATPASFGWWRAQTLAQGAQTEDEAPPTFRVKPVGTGTVPAYQRQGVE